MPQSLLVKWTKDLHHLQSNPRSKKWSRFPGPNGQLHCIEHELLIWVFSQRKQGISIRNSLAHLKASSLLPNTFGAKSIEAHYKAVECFMHKHDYIYRMKTNESKHPPHEVYEEAREFMELTYPLLHGPHCNRHWIFNMDHMAIHFLYQSSKTYAKRGTKTIHVRKTSNGTKRATGVLTVTAVSNFLMPMIIFKGKPNGKIAQCEIKNFDPTSVYTCQDTAWMDERCMLMRG